MNAKRELAVEYFVKALSTGEISAAQRVANYLASDVEYDTNTQPGILPVGRAVYKGRHEVLEQIGQLWPATPGYSRLGWAEPVEFLYHCSTKWAVYLLSLKALVETGTGSPSPDDVAISDWH